MSRGVQPPNQEYYAQNNEHQENRDAKIWTPPPQYNDNFGEISLAPSQQFYSEGKRAHHPQQFPMQPYALNMQQMQQPSQHYQQFHNKAQYYKEPWEGTLLQYNEFTNPNRNDGNPLPENTEENHSWDDQHHLQQFFSKFDFHSDQKFNYSNPSHRPLYSQTRSAQKNNVRGFPKELIMDSNSATNNMSIDKMQATDHSFDYSGYHPGFLLGGQNKQI